MKKPALLQSENHFRRIAAVVARLIDIGSRGFAERLSSNQRKSGIRIVVQAHGMIHPQGRVSAAQAAWEQSRGMDAVPTTALPRRRMRATTISLQASARRDEAPDRLLFALAAGIASQQQEAMPTAP